MGWLTHTFKHLLPRHGTPRSGARKARRPLRRRLELELLEDRSVPAATASGTITGVAFMDTNQNGLLDSGETSVTGAAFTLTGTTDQGTPVNTTASTDVNGAYSFINVLPGTYQVSVSPVPGVLGGSSPDGVQTAPFSVGGGQTVIENFTFLGLGPDNISLREFLTTTTASDFSLPTAGSGQGQAGPRANNAPTVATAITNFSVPTDSPDKVFDLAGVFTDPDITDTQVRLNTSAGAVNIELFDKLAPRTVANFLNYVQSGRYDNSIFHRLVSGFVLQGGGFTFDAANPSLNAITTDPAVQNEFGTSNTKGTLAMAKLGSDPNSATSQFFFNLADNSSNLDSQNGGFTVFGKLMSAADQSVVDTLAGLTAQDESKGDPNSPFTQIPLSGYNGTNFPKDTTASNYDLVQSAQVVSQNEKLTYSVVSNSNPGVVTASVVNNRLTLHYPAHAAGVATLTVRATDQFGATVDDTFQVVVGNVPPTAKVTLSPSSPGPASTLTATVSASDVNNDPTTLTYVWKVNGTVEQTTSATKNTTDTFDLSKVPNVHKGAQVTVDVTPNDGQADGAAAEASVTVGDTAPSVNVSLTPGVATPTDTLTATASPADIDGDPVTLSYVWTRADGSVFHTTLNTTSTTDSVNLSTVTGIQAGSQVHVSVTPSDGTLSGAAATASATIDNRPFVSSALSNVSVAHDASPTVLDLAGNFSDADISDSQVVINTSGGPINVELFDTQAPRTVANFLNYVNSGAYNNAIFHRNSPGFVLQGGGFTFNSATTNLDTIPTDPKVLNEPDPVNRSNTTGTIAMAKLPGDPNSATDQFFFNLANNNNPSDPLSLDIQNGGFTVFGKIVSASDQQSINNLTSLPIKDESFGDINNPFGSIPLQRIPNNDPSFPHNTTASDYALINSVQIVRQTEALTYQVLSNTNQGLVAATIKNNRLTLTYTPAVTGSATITVQATDKAGLTVTTSFTVQVS